MSIDIQKGSTFTNGSILLRHDHHYSETAFVFFLNFINLLIKKANRFLHVFPDSPAKMSEFFLKNTHNTKCSNSQPPPEVFFKKDCS